MKINYLILAHKNLNQLKRLVWRLSLDNPADFSIYIHLDKKWNLSNEEIKSIEKINDNVTVIPTRVSCKLDNWSLIEAELQLVEFSLKKNSSDAYFVMMSGQDYPIKSNNLFVEFCKDKYPKPLIDVTPWSPNNWVNLKFMNSPLYHSLYQFNPKNKSLNFIFRIFRRGIDTLIPKKYKMKSRLDKLGINLFGGSQWWVLPTPALKEIIEEYYKNEPLIKIYKKTLTPDETFFQTMVMRTSFSNIIDINPSNQVTQNCPTFAYFNPEGMKFTGHPYIITKEVWKEINPATYFFARKFDESVDASVFDLIDSQLNH